MSRTPTFRSPMPVLCFRGMLALALGAAPTPRPHPALVLVVVVDQMRGDYLDRFRPQWTGGFARLLRQGAVFPRGLQDHAITETAPGHATVLSGRNPAHVGIVTNQRGVPDPEAPLLEAEGPGASPRRFVGTELYDWMRAADPGARVLSVSRKDRGAILPVGRSKGQVYWYVGGRFTTSRYYADTLPGWVKLFNQRQGPQHLAGSTWALLRPDSAYHERDDMAFENGGRDRFFPHHLPPTAEGVARALPYYPWMDSLTLDFALDGVARLALGRRDRPDLLVISLSATDYVGHAFGPDSREIHDQLLRLDHWLGWFLDSLAREVPPQRTLLVLTADHGVVPFPELSATKSPSARRVSLVPILAPLRGALAARGGPPAVLQFESGLLYGDIPALRTRGFAPDSLAEALARQVRLIPGVTRVFTPGSLAQTPDSDREAARWRRSLAPGLEWLFCASIAPGDIWASGDGETTHGSTNPDDVTVPLVFMGPGVRPSRSDRPVRTIDIAPTLAKLLGLTPLERLDGVPIGEVAGKQ